MGSGLRTVYSITLNSHLSLSSKYLVADLTSHGEGADCLRASRALEEDLKWNVLEVQLNSEGTVRR